MNVVTKRRDIGQKYFPNSKLTTSLAVYLSVEPIYPTTAKIPNEAVSKKEKITVG